jgi:hypothetical protein
LLLLLLVVVVLVGVVAAAAAAAVAVDFLYVFLIRHNFYISFLKCSLPIASVNHLFFTVHFIYPKHNTTIHQRLL